MLLKRIIIQIVYVHVFESFELSPNLLFCLQVSIARISRLQLHRLPRPWSAPGELMRYRSSGLIDPASQIVTGCAKFFNDR